MHHPPLNPHFFLLYLLSLPLVAFNASFPIAIATRSQRTRRRRRDALISGHDLDAQATLVLALWVVVPDSVQAILETDRLLLLGRQTSCCSWRRAAGEEESVRFPPLIRRPERGHCRAQISKLRKRRRQPNSRSSASPTQPKKRSMILRSGTMSRSSPSTGPPLPVSSASSERFLPCRPLRKCTGSMCVERGDASGSKRTRRGGLGAGEG